MNISYLLKDIQSVAIQLLNFSDNHIWLFYGQMGIGKTTLIKSLCQQWGVLDYTTSPTFSIVNEYLTTQGKIYHFDLYRLKSTAELLDIGFEDYVSSDEQILIEWPELAIPFLPKEVTKIDIQMQQQERRILTVK